MAERDYNTEEAIARFLIPDDARYFVYCLECAVGWKYQRDCKTTKATRRGDATCPDCGLEVELLRDPKADEGAA